MDMQLELTTPVIAKRGSAWKKACAAGAAALVVGCVAVGRVGDSASFHLVTSSADTTWDDIKDGISGDAITGEECAKIGPAAGDDGTQAGVDALTPACVTEAVGNFKKLTKDLKESTEKWNEITTKIGSLKAHLKTLTGDFEFKQLDKAEKEMLEIADSRTVYNIACEVPAECSVEPAADASVADKKEVAKACVEAAFLEIKKFQLAVESKVAIKEHKDKAKTCADKGETIVEYIEKHHPEIAEDDSIKGKFEKVVKAYEALDAHMSSWLSQLMWILLAACMVILVGGGSYYYFVVMKKKASIEKNTENKNEN